LKQAASKWAEKYEHGGSAGSGKEDSRRGGKATVTGQQGPGVGLFDDPASLKPQHAARSAKHGRDLADESWSSYIKREKRKSFGPLSGLNGDNGEQQIEGGGIAPLDDGNKDSDVGVDLDGDGKTDFIVDGKTKTMRETSTGSGLAGASSGSAKQDGYAGWQNLRDDLGKTSILGSKRSRQKLNGRPPAAVEQHREDALKLAQSNLKNDDQDDEP
jgi:hypothetical protein